MVPAFTRCEKAFKFQMLWYVLVGYYLCVCVGGGVAWELITKFFLSSYECMRIASLLHTNIQALGKSHGNPYFQRARKPWALNFIIGFIKVTLREIFL